MSIFRLFPWCLLLALTLFGPAVVAAEPFAYITNFTESGTVSVIDTATPKVTVTVPVGRFPVGVALNPSGSLVFVANNGDGSVSVIDAPTNTVTATIGVGASPYGIAVDPTGTTAYVANFGDGTVSVIDVAKNALNATTPTVTVGSGPAGVVFHPARPLAYVTNFGDGTVSLIDTTSHAVTKTLTVGEGPAGIAVNLAGTRVYVALQGEGKVAVIDGTTDAVSADSFTVESGPTGVAVSPSGGSVYTANQFSGSVSVIDVGSGDVSHVAVGAGAFGLSVHPSGASVYVANSGDDSVSVIDTATGNVTKTVSDGIGPGPFAFGQFITPLAASGRQVTALGSAALWIGVTNSDDNGRRLDVKVEIYRNDELIGEGVVTSRPVSGNALANATAVSVPLSLAGGPVTFAPTDVLVSRVWARRAGGSGDVNVRLWYGNAAPPPASRRGWSHFTAAVDGAETRFYYRGAGCPSAPCSLPLLDEPGSAGVAAALRAAAAYRSFGDWRTAQAP